MIAQLPQYPQPVDCEDILDADPAAGSGVYKIYPVGSATPISVYCDMVALGGGWTVIQRHYDNTVSFNRNSSDYTDGFGSMSGNYYLGNKWIQMLTDGSTTGIVYKLAVVVEDTTGEKRTSMYQAWWLTATYYAVNAWGYNANNDIEVAGDGFTNSYSRYFQTPDLTYGQSCPPLRTSGT